VLVRLCGIPEALFARDDFYPVLGYLLGSLVDEEILVVEGIGARPTEDQLKSLAAAAATSGSVALFHLLGITPEATTMADAFGKRPPARTIDVDLPALRKARAALTTAIGDRLDVVAFGSPHCSFSECKEIASMVAGRRAAAGVDLFVTTSRAVRDLLERSGELRTLLEFGAKVTADTCIVVSPLVRRSARVLMTNSAKYAHYAPGLIGVHSVFGSTEDCVASAVAGRIVVEDGPWAD
jgi:predicted aconitase